VAVRGRGNRELGVMPLEAFALMLQTEVRDRTHEARAAS
jgi:hypothetical protein